MTWQSFLAGLGGALLSLFALCWFRVFVWVMDRYSGSPTPRWVWPAMVITLPAAVFCLVAAAPL